MKKACLLLLTAALAAPVAAAAAGAAVSGGAMPGRTSVIAYEPGDTAWLDQVLDRAIAGAESRNGQLVAAALKRLRAEGTPFQKAVFVYGPARYSFPEEFQGRAPALKSVPAAEAGPACVNYCYVHRETVLRWTCDAEGNCADVPVEVEVTTCEMICDGAGPAAASPR